MRYKIYAFTLTIVLFLQLGCSKANESSNTTATPVSPPQNEQPTVPAEPPMPSAPQEPKTCLNQWGTNTEWSNEVEIQIQGYSQSAMEPKVSADGGVLFWNDKPAGGDTLMNVHYAVKQSDQTWLYIGNVPGTVDNSNLDGVPALDSSLNFYFVSTRSYGSNLQTIFGGQLSVLGFNSLAVNSVLPADTGIRNTQPGFLDMDIDISWDGNLMVVSRAFFTVNPYPETSELKLFSVSARQASNISNSDDLLAQVNSPLCRTYAGSFSDDKKELYFTVMPVNSNSQNDFRILVAKRNAVNEPFGKPQIISGINGNLIEGPSLTQDGRKLFFHKFDSVSGRFKIYQVSR